MRDKRVELLRGVPQQGLNLSCLPFTPTTHIVQTAGLEPAFPIQGTALNRMRLPVTPRLHIIPDMGFEPISVVGFEPTAYTKFC